MAQAPQNPPSDTGYRLIDKRFSLDFGPQWIDRSIYRFEGPLEDGIQHYITVSIESDLDQTDLEAYATLQIKALANELQGYHELKRGPLLLASRQPAYELVYQWCPAEGVELYQRHLWVLHQRMGYALTAAFSKKTWKLLGDEVDRILRSLRLPADSGR
jgi:hypothetical protein